MDREEKLKQDIDSVKQNLEKVRSEKNRDKESYLLQDLGKLYSELGETDLAESSYKEALSVLGDVTTSTESERYQSIADYYNRARDIVQDKIDIESVPTAGKTGTVEGGTIDAWRPLSENLRRRRLYWVNIILVLYAIALAVGLISFFLSGNSLALIALQLPLALSLGYYFGKSDPNRQR